MCLSSKDLSPGMSYYHLLSQPEQRAYLSLVAGIKEFSPAITIPLKTQDHARIKRIITAIHRDCPELYFVDYRHYRKNPRIPMATIRFDYLYSSQIRDIETSLADFWRTLKPNVTRARNIKDKYRIMALEIAETMTHRAQELCDYSLAGPMTGRCGACEALSKLLLYCCRKAAIPAVLVIGTCMDKGHSWVKVWINSKVRFIDITVIQECPFLFRVFPGFILMPRIIAYLLGYRELP